MSNSTITPTAAADFQKILDEEGIEGFRGLLVFCEYFAFMERNFLSDNNERNIKIKTGSRILRRFGDAWLQTLHT